MNEPALIRHKGVLIIIDGLGDLPVSSLQGKTPLEAADTPSMDYLASQGRIGLVDPIRPGIVPGTHSGTGLLMGLAPDQLDLLNRGPVEVAGLGFVLNPGDIALRANFATLERHAYGLRIRDRRAGRIMHGTDELAKSLGRMDLGDAVVATLIPTDQHRAALILSGPGLDARITDTDPKDGGMPSDVMSCRHLHPAAELTANKINRFMQEAHQCLQDHPVNRQRVLADELPANGILTRSAGSQHALKNVIRELGIKTALVSGCNTVRGLGRTFGFDVIEDSRFTAGTDTDVEAKTGTAKSLLSTHDLVIVHIKGTDICSHDRNPALKRDLLEKLDRSIASLVHAGVVIAIGADHTTDSGSGCHTADPVPALIASPGDHSEQATVKFGESACATGSLTGLRNHGFLKQVLGEMGTKVR